MPITAASLKIFDAEAMDDTATGGGRRGPNALLTGVQNNVFPDATEDDFLAGRVKVRKLYPSVVADDASLLQAATLRINAPPSDPLVSVCLVAYGTDATRRAEFDAQGAPYASDLPLLTGGVPAGGGYTPAYAAQYYSGVSGGDDTVAVVGSVTEGDIISLERMAGSSFQTPFVQVGTVEVAGGVVLPLYDIRFGGASRGQISLHYVTGVVSGDIIFTPPLPGAAVPHGVILRKPTIAGGRAYGVVPVTGALSATDDTLTLTSWTTPIIPQGTAYPSVNPGLDAAIRAGLGGLAPVVATGDLATLYHEDETTPASQVNTDVIDVGRTNLGQMALVDANGDEIGRVLSDGVVPSGVGFTVDLAAGTLTCVDVSGWAQPVSVRHRIEERVSIANARGPAITLGAGLARAFPSGSFLTTELPLGDLQPTVGARFSQQAWTRVWSDSLIGAAVGTLYPGEIGLQADGAENDRFACVFTSATQYTLHSERWGVVGSGNVGSDYVPLNPQTGQPLLTLYAAGWAAGSIALGNVFRFNVRGAYGNNAWGLQSIAPGTGTAGSSAMIVMRGSIDA